MNTIDPISQDELSECKNVIHFVEDDGMIHAYDADNLTEYINSTGTLFMPLTRRCIRLGELWRLNRASKTGIRVEKLQEAKLVKADLISAEEEIQAYLDCVMSKLADNTIAPSKLQHSVTPIIVSAALEHIMAPNYCHHPTLAPQGHRRKRRDCICECLHRNVKNATHHHKRLKTTRTEKPFVNMCNKSIAIICDLARE